MKTGRENKGADLSVHSSNPSPPNTSGEWIPTWEDCLTQAVSQPRLPSRNTGEAGGVLLKIPHPDYQAKSPDKGLGISHL